MLRITPGENDACAQIVLAPNNSAGWGGNLVFLMLLGVVTFIVALVCLFAGAGVIVFFCGLELALVYFALRYVSRRCASQEVLSMTPYQVLLERGVKSPEEQWQFQRFHTQVRVEQDDSHKTHVALVCQDVVVPVGEFLNDQERSQLIRHLRQLVACYRQRYL